jgi:exodeoxyribonuclease V alpha subunit
LQDLFNPLNEDFDRIPSKFKYENGFTFRVKDKIIRTENDYTTSKMRANGEEAEIIEYDGNKVVIQYSGPSDRPEKIGINELYENFTLNYCVTIHKSQGSQYTNVVFFIEPDQNIIDKQPTYTAISRAKEKCFVISSDKEFINCQRIKSDDKKMSQFMEISDNYNFE